jgi:alkyldihydroxyacetonephosphate synthase
LITYAAQTGACLIPFGGGTSVVGGINPRSQDPPTLTLDLSRLNRLSNLDEVSRLATFEAGVAGPDLESQLKVRGYTLGHFPQSFELSTLGGWIATRSTGQQSYYYGRIEDLFAGGHLETPAGPLDLPPLPASAAGPDLRQVVLGSEGRLGIITRAAIRIRPLPETESFHACFFRDWETGAEAVRQVAQAGIRLSMMRLSDSQETETTLALSGREHLITWADRGLRTLGYGSRRCLLIYGVTGDQRMASEGHRHARSALRSHGGLYSGKMIGEQWRKTRFTTPYLRNTLWERGYALDTLESAMPWAGLLPAAEAVKLSLRTTLEATGQAGLVFAHLSHHYRDGAGFYITFMFRRSPDPDETLNTWKQLKDGASRSILAHGGTITHQHAVGTDHAPYLQAEKGALGMQLLDQAARTFDPGGLLNPGKLLPR